MVNLAPGANYWQNSPGKPFVTVSSGPTASTGADFGSDTPNGGSVSTATGQQISGQPALTTTNGIQEAVNAVSAVGGGVVFLIPTGIFTYTTQITHANNVELLSYMGGGEAFGPSFIMPTSYLSFTGPASVQDTFLATGLGSVSMFGISFVSNVGGLRSVVRVNGTRGLDEYDCTYVSLASGVAAKLMDGAALPGSSAVNCEDNMDISCFVSGDPGFQIGISGEGQHCNDCLHIALTGEGLVNSNNKFTVRTNGAVIMHNGGGNQQFFNFYSRGDTSTNSNAYQYNNTGTASSGMAIFVGGEQQALATIGGVSTPGGLWSLNSGTTWAIGMTFTAGVVAQAANLGLIGVRVLASTAVTHNLSSGDFWVDNGSIMTDWACTQSGGVIYGPQSVPFNGAGNAVLGWSSYSRSAGTFFPGGASTSSAIPTNPPSTGVTYQNGSLSGSWYYFHVTTTGTLTVNIQAQSGTTIATPYSGVTFPVNAYLTFYVPAGGFFVVTLGTAVLAAGVAIGM